MLRFSAVGVGLVYGSMKLSVLKVRWDHAALALAASEGAGLGSGLLPWGVEALRAHPSPPSVQSQAAKAAKKH